MPIPSDLGLCCVLHRKLSLNEQEFVDRITSLEIDRYIYTWLRVPYITHNVICKDLRTAAHVNLIVRPQ